MMRKRIITGTTVAIIVVALSIIFLTAEDTNALDNNVLKLGSANTQFAFKLFREIAAKDSGKNIFISPPSAAIALAMAYNGSAGETQRQMEEALQLSGMTPQETNLAYSGLLKMLQAPASGVEIVIANSLWGNKKIEFKKEFIKSCELYFDARVDMLDFSNPNAPSIINTWVKQSTKGLIDSIIDAIQPMDVMFLINAIYFKGIWTNKFDEARTRDREFHLLNGGRKKHPMMSQSGKFKYFRGDDFQAICLPYADETMSMYIFLPDSISGIHRFIEKIDAMNFEKWVSNMRPMKGDISIPRFKMSYDIKLNDALKALGMKDAFTGKANFSKMTPMQVLISYVRQKTFVEVDEEGTKAAAVTAVGMTLTSAEPPQRFHMVADHPFFCVIRDDGTGVVLFMGTIVEPM